MSQNPFISFTDAQFQRMLADVLNEAIQRDMLRVSLQPRGRNKKFQYGVLAKAFPVQVGPDERDKVGLVAVGVSETDADLLHDAFEDGFNEVLEAQARQAEESGEPEPEDDADHDGPGNRRRLDYSPEKIVRMVREARQAFLAAMGPHPSDRISERFENAGELLEQLDSELSTAFDVAMDEPCPDCGGEHPPGTDFELSRRLDDNALVHMLSGILHEACNRDLVQVYVNAKDGELVGLMDHCEPVHGEGGPLFLACAVGLPDAGPQPVVAPGSKMVQ